MGIPKVKPPPSEGSSLGGKAVTPLAGIGQEEKPSHMGLDEKKLSPLSWLDILGRAMGVMPWTVARKAGLGCDQ